MGFFIFPVLTSFSQTDSLQVYYYPNGNISSQGTVFNGKPNGEWKTFFPDGTLKSVGVWENGKLNGFWQFFGSDGMIKRSLFYRNGIKNGISIEYQTIFIKGIFSVVPKSIELFENNLRIGIGKYYNSKGCLERIIHFKEGRFHGNGLLLNCDSNIFEIQYYQSGKLVDRERVNTQDSAGNKDGKWLTFHTNYDIKEEINYKNGVKEGWHRVYKSNGDLDFSLLYNDGVLYSNNSSVSFDYLEYFDSSGSPYFGSFLGTTPVGTHISADSVKNNCKEYSLHGNIVGEGKCTSKGVKVGEWILFNDKGNTISKGSFSNGIKQGSWQFFFENGKIEQLGSFVNGKEHGKWIWFFSSGRVRKEENYRYGVLSGEFFEFDSLGNEIVRGYFSDGLEEGEWIVKIGDIVWKGIYNFGELDGKSFSRFLNGNLFFEGSFFHGSHEGCHKYFFEDGTLKEEQYWKRGERVGTWKKYSEDGTVLISVTYRNGEEYLINGVKVKY